MESLGELDQLEIPTGATDEPVPASQTEDRIRAVEVRLAIAAAEVGGIALDFLNIRDRSLPEGAESLTLAEHEHLKLMSQGLGIQEAAQQLWVTPETVKYHRSHVYKKLGVSGGLKAVAIYNEATNQETARKEKVIKAAGLLMMVANRIFQNNISIFRLSPEDQEMMARLSQALIPEDNKESAQKILGRIPLAMYEVLTMLDEGASRAQAAEKLCLSEEYVWEHMRRMYELFEVNQPGDVLKSIASLVKASGYAISFPSQAEGDPRDHMPKEVSELTNGELDVLGCVCLGLPNKHIAKERFVTPQTIKFHLTNIYEKLGVENRTAASAIAIRCGLVEWALTLDGSSDLMSTTRKVYLEKVKKVPGQV
ncbi:MAG TPA: LuxR C-terminal-related transcriptional regulator [Candidatus Saccharimonadales bacterium]|nr:LuxR C-terminal-related transcriptional regulator [Candidatus Saccharimonadales bacterium]